MEFSIIGKRIKQARLNKQLTQEGLAQLSGYTKSFISKIEHGHTAAALATLSKIADCLDVPMSWLLDDESQHKDISIVKASERKIKSGGGQIGYLYETLANRSRFSKIEPVVVTVCKEATQVKPFTHHESEFIYVLKGSIHLSYGDTIYPMAEGDSAYFAGQKAHVFLPVSDDEAQVLTIYIQEGP